MMRRIRKILDARGISMRACADLLGVAEKTIYNKMVGSTDFTYQEVKKLKAILPEYDIDYLLSDDPGISA